MVLLHWTNAKQRGASEQVPRERSLLPLADSPPGALMEGDVIGGGAGG